MITVDGTAPVWAHVLVRQIDQFLISLFNPANLSTAGTITAKNATATTAGGAPMLLFGTTAGFGIYAGSGVPTVSAGKGSLYLRTDGTTTNNRAYINSDGSTTWVSLTTSA